jgi:hypothetical protein
LVENYLIEKIENIKVWKLLWLWFRKHKFFCKLKLRLLLLLLLFYVVVVIVVVVFVVVVVVNLFLDESCSTTAFKNSWNFFRFPTAVNKNSWNKNENTLKFKTGLIFEKSGFLLDITVLNIVKAGTTIFLFTTCYCFVATPRMCLCRP